MKIFLLRYIHWKKCKSVLEVVQFTTTLKKIVGLSVFQLKNHQQLGLVCEFSLLGFVLNIIYSVLYTFCAYRAFSGDQTILRNLYPTKLRHYGDMAERVMSVLFAIYAGWKISYRVGSTTSIIKKLQDIDQKVENLGVAIDHGRAAYQILLVAISQLVLVSVRMITVLVTLNNLAMSVPIEVVIQATITVSLALVTAVHYCNHVYIIKTRYKILNNLLSEIKDRKAWEQRVLLRGKQELNMLKVQNYQDKYVCEKMRSCAKVYGLLLKAAEDTQEIYGFSLVCTMLFCLLYIVLYLFYFMEATAYGLFHDTQRYIYFLIYVLWQIWYTAGVIFLNIYFSEDCVEEAKKSSYIVHEIINADISSSITTEAMRFSLQILHQIPVFTACGLCRVDYMLLLQGAYSVATFLVILLQFVTD